MPVLEWRCQNCKKEFEELRRIDEEARDPVNDPVCCSKPELKRFVGKAPGMNASLTWRRHGRKGQW